MLCLRIHLPVVSIYQDRRRVPSPSLRRSAKGVSPLSATLCVNGLTHRSAGGAFIRNRLSLLFSGSIDTFYRSGRGNGGLSVGRATFWLCVISSNFNMESFAMEAATTSAPTSSSSGAFGRAPAVIPGIVQAEDFDNGGEGIAYSDTDPGNNGGVC